VWFDRRRSLIPQITIPHENLCDDRWPPAMPVRSDLHDMPLPICSGKSLVEPFARQCRSDPLTRHWIERTWLEEA
jgi:hypothetical protein